MTFNDLLNTLLMIAYLISSFGLFLYGINYYAMILMQRRARERMLKHDEAVWMAWAVTDRELPQVTIQLPTYNERYVIQRLIEAVVRLDYPKDRLEIQLLDDSTDETTAIAAQLTEQYRQEGFDITLRHRRQRTGYKAGALKQGLEVAKGEFIAIFDADFTPPPDFLRRTLPFFVDPAIAVVQTRWGYINQDYSLLTRSQTYAIDGHFWVEQTARCWSGFFLHFNGTAGIWRRKAIDDAGGWQADTLTEDIDLSYRAQLRGWRIKFLPQVVCPAELPVQMCAIKAQHYRWAMGSFQTAKKLIPRVLKAEVPLLTKYQAVLHLGTYMLFPFILVLTLTAPPLPLFEKFHSTRDHFLGIAIVVSISSFGPFCCYLYAQTQLYDNWKRRLVYFPSLLVLVTGITLNSTMAILEAVLNVHKPFARTPKFRIERSSDTWVDKRYRVPFPWLSLFEALIAVYYAYGIFLLIQRGKYLIGPLFILTTMGFTSVALLSLWEFLQSSVGRPEPAQNQLGSARPTISADPKRQ
ncbi:MAG: glycosyltransferase [Deltaproteobacteria bacterium]|nr:glycosyltransferase [Deltaproteobacteria bacterium]